VNLSSEDLQSKLKRHSRLGHVKRDKAFLRQVTLACSCPGLTLAAARERMSNSSMAGLASFYRFEHSEVEVSQIRSIRDAVVAESIPLGSEVLIVHDVTLLDYSRHRSKSDRRAIGNHVGMGYEYVACLAVESGTGQMLGLVHETVVSERGPDDADVMDYNYEELFSDFSEHEKQKMKSNHRHQMAVHINGLAKKLPGRRIIHVGDREFDDLFIIGRCQQTGSEFVIRTNADRNVQVPQYPWIPKQAFRKKEKGHAIEPDWVCVELRDLIQAVPVRTYKTVPVDSTNRVTDSGSAARLAELGIGVCKVRLYRDAKRNNRYFRTSQTLCVNMIVVRETNPGQTRTPLCWILFTSLPVDSEAQQNHVVRCYELRWKVETYFRLLKSGYQIESYRLDNADKIAKLLVVLSLAAMVVTNLKSSLGLPAQGKLNDQQYRMIKGAITQINNPELSLELRLLALIVKFGGWLGRRNDPIGASKLMRGVLFLLASLDAWQDHAPLMQEAAQNRNLIRKLLGI